MFNIFNLFKKNDNQKSFSKMYVIVRNDLSNIYRMVQGAHALSQYAIDHPLFFDEIWNNQYLIFLSVFNLIELKEVEQLLIEKRVTYSKFYEPDLDHQLTAIAFYHKGDIVSHLSLAKIN